MELVNEQTVQTFTDTYTNMTANTQVYQTQEYSKTITNTTFSTKLQ